jgi:hypothetical protein
LFFCLLMFAVLLMRIAVRILDGSLKWLSWELINYEETVYKFLVEKRLMSLFQPKMEQVE